MTEYVISIKHYSEKVSAINHFNVNCFNLWHINLPPYGEIIFQ